MARVAPVNYVPIPPQAFGPSQSIKEGSAVGYTGELDLIENVHYCHAWITPQFVAQSFNSDGSNGAAIGPIDYTAPALTGAYVAKAAWRRKVYRDLPAWKITVWYTHDGAVNPANDGFAQFQLASDPTKLIAIRLVAGSGMWTQALGDLVGDPAVAGGIDTIEMYMKNGAAGTAYVKSVCIYPRGLTNPLNAGVTTEGVVPFDDTEDGGANDPLPVWLRQSELDNCEILRKTRAGTISAWSELLDIRGPATHAAYSTTGLTYTVVARLPFETIKGQTAIQWAVLGYYTAGVGGSVRLQTGHMINKKIAPITYSFGNVWATPFQVWHDDGGSTLTTVENNSDFIEIAIAAGAGSTCYLMGWGFWLKDVT